MNGSGAIFAGDLPARAATLLDRLRAQPPRVHCVMNTVVQKLVADALSAIGAVPSMTTSREEIESFVMRSDALAINLGTLDEDRRVAIGLATRTAGREGRRWVLDPAHCDYSPVRAAYARELLAVPPTVLRANAAEVDMLSVPRDVVCATTGATDRITLGARTALIENGHPWMARVTGTGCASGALIAAFLAVADDPFEAVAAALLCIGVAAEKASEHARGPGSFEPAWLDALATLSAQEIVAGARIGDE